MSRLALALRVAVSLVLAVDAVVLAFAASGRESLAYAPLVLIALGLLVLAFGLPTYLLLLWARQERWWSCVLAGCLVGATVAMMETPAVSGLLVQDGTVLVDGGARTLAGWRVFAEGIGIAAGVGGVVGLVAWGVLRLLSRGGAGALAAGIGVAVAASWTVWAIPGLTMDGSCLNILRDGRGSISSVLHFTVELEGGEWPRLQAVADAFAAEQGWRIDRTNDQDKAFSPGRFVSTCAEPGTDIRLSGREIAERSRADVSVFQPQGGAEWRGPAAVLLARIEAAFPGRLRRDWSGTEAVTGEALLRVP